MKKPVNIITNGSDCIIHVVFTDNTIYKFNIYSWLSRVWFFTLTGVSLMSVMRSVRYKIIDIPTQTITTSGAMK